jgi:hypothetical protein
MKYDWSEIASAIRGLTMVIWIFGFFISLVVTATALARIAELLKKIADKDS